MAARKVSAIEFETVGENATTVIDGAILRITTASTLFSGTDANVYIAVSSREKQLDTPNHNDFERNDDDMYSLYPLVVDGTLGDLRNSSISIYHDNTGTNAKWKISRVCLYLLPHGWSAGGKWLIYKDWRNVGWLQGSKKDDRTVILQ